MIRATRSKGHSSRFRTWLLENRIEEMQGPHIKEAREQHPWWQVVCLTGVDYYSTLGYIPGIAGLAAGALSPIATMFIVLLTLFGMLPAYRRVAYHSPHGQGSIAMLEHLLSFWKGKIFVLCLLGFVGTAWMFTITLSAADGATHLAENPIVPSFLHDKETAITLVLLAILGGVFLKGFREAIGIAIVLVFSYLFLNLLIVIFGFYMIFQHPAYLSHWKDALLHGYGNPLDMVVVSFLVFPQLALGLSGFETGVSMMPLVKGDPDDDPQRPAGRIRNTRKMLTAAALIMSFFLITTSFVTTVLIPHREFEPGGKAAGRALAYLAHQYMGNAFGTIYDISTITILWFGGASALTGLLNIVPRYLPRYGMAPEWGRAVRPMVLVFSAIAFAITLAFNAGVDSQSGPYATGVLIMMTSAAVAVTIAVRRQRKRRSTLVFGLITLVMLYADVENIRSQPNGIVISILFIVAIIFVSLVSRALRSTELRQESIELDDAAWEFINEALYSGEIHIIANRRQAGDRREYELKEREQREANHIPREIPVLFLEVEVADPSEFTDVMEVRGARVDGYRVLRAESSSVPNAIAAFLLYLREKTGAKPHCYFGWTEGNPLVYLVRYILFGEGDIPPVTREVLREAEPDPGKRPAIHVGG